MSIHEECGVFGVFSQQPADLASLTYYGLYALQHRGHRPHKIVGGVGLLLGAVAAHQQNGQQYIPHQRQGQNKIKQNFHTCSLFGRNDGYYTTTIHHNQVQVFNL